MLEYLRNDDRVSVAALECWRGVGKEVREVRGEPEYIRPFPEYIRPLWIIVRHLAVIFSEILLLLSRCSRVRLCATP